MLNARNKIVNQNNNDAPLEDRERSPQEIKNIGDHGGVFLVCPTYGLALKLSPFPYYPHAWRVEDSNECVHVLSSALIPLSSSELSSMKVAPPQGCKIAMRVQNAKEEEAFFYFWNFWRDNDLTVYRGMATCHWKWPELARGHLISEGEMDTPTWTMMNAQTRWLPTTPEKREARAICINMIDDMSRKISDIRAVPVGLAVAIQVGLGTTRKICWTNSGEYLVRGPLSIADYQHDVVMWFGPEGFQTSNVPTWATHQLPRVRPAQPTYAALMEWCEEWDNMISDPANGLLPYNL